MRRRINLPLLGGTLLCLVLVCVGVYFVHRWQIDRNASSLLVQARHAAKAKASDQSLLYYRRYLQQRPDDTEAMIEYALALDKVATSDEDLIRALGLVEQALLRDTKNTKLRREAIRMSLDLGFLKEAANHIQAVLEETPNDAKLWQSLGQCYRYLEKYDDAEQAYRNAIAHDPKSITSHIELARLLHHDLGRPNGVLKVLDRLVAANPKMDRVYVSRANYLKSRGEVAAARKDLAKALELSPKKASTILNLAKLDQGDGQLEEASRTLEKGLEYNPKSIAMYGQLSKIYLAQRRPNDAIDVLREGLKKVPNARLLQVTLAELLVTTGRLDEADVVLDSLRTKHSVPGATTCLRARRWMQKGNWKKARELLESHRSDLVDSPWKAQYHYLLGECYRHLGDSPRATGAYQRAVQAAPLWTLAKYGLAAAYIADNRAREALEMLRLIEHLPDAPSDTKLLIVEALSTQNRQLPANEQNWTQAGQVLEELPKSQANSIRGIMARVECQVAQNRYAEARRVLEDFLTSNSIHKEDKTHVRIALADLARKQGKVQKAQQMLTQIENDVGLSPVNILAWIRFWNGQDSRTALKGLAILQAKLNKLPVDDSTRLRRALALAFAQQGDYETAEKMMKAIAREHPKDIQSRFFLLNRAFQKYRKESAAKLIAKLKQLEGGQRILWRVSRATWIVEFHNPREAALWNEAKQHLTRLQKVRPNWRRALILAGTMAEKEGKETVAADFYLRAVNLGETQKTTILKLGDLLLRHKRHGDARELLQTLQARGPLSKDEAKFAAEVAVRRGDNAEAIQFARSSVPLGARDYRERLWLVDLLERAGEPTLAEEVLRELTKHSGYVPDVWIAWVEHLQKNNLTKKLPQAFSEIAKNMPADRAQLTIARCYDRIGQTAKAEAVFREVAKSDDYFASRHLADFYLRHEKYAKAEAVLQKMTHPRHQLPRELLTDARNKLALSLARQNHPAKFREALALLRDDKASSPNVALETVRTRGLVLATNPSRAKEAIQTFQACLTSRPTDTEVMWHLAELYRQEKEYRKAADVLAQFIRLKGNDAKYLTVCVETLLEIPNVSKAETYQVELEKIAPQSQHTKLLRNRINELRQKREKGTR